MPRRCDNGKPIRETRDADVPLAADHFRYFAGCIRAEEGSLGEIDNDTIAYHFQEPMGVVGQIIPWNFPLLMAAWKLAPALACGNCVVIKPASDTPLSLAVLMDLIGDMLPPGVLNVVFGHGSEVGAPLASSPRIAKVGFTGETTTGRQIMQYAAENLIPSTMELGGKSPNIFMADVMDADDAFFDKALEGFALFAFNKGEVCTCPSRALVQESIFDKFMEKAVARVGRIKVGDPLDPTTRWARRPRTASWRRSSTTSTSASRKARSCVTGGEQRASRRRTGERLLPQADRVRRPQQDAHLPGGDLRPGPVGDHVQGPWTTQSRIGNDTIYGLGAGVWSRNGNGRLSRRPRDQGRPRVDQLLPRCIRRTRRSAATSSRASAARRTR